MLEFIIIYCFIYAGRFWQLRGKSFDELTTQQIEMVCKALNKDRSRRNKLMPDQYLARIQKNVVPVLMIAIFSTILWFILVFIVFPNFDFFS